MAASVTKQPLELSPIEYTFTFDHRVNMYSKPIVVIMHARCIMSYSAISFIRFLTILIMFIIMFKEHIFTKVEFIVYQNVFNESCKNVCSAQKIIVQCRTNNGKYHVSLYSFGSYSSSKNSFDWPILLKFVKIPIITSIFELK